MKKIKFNRRQFRLFIHWMNERHRIYLARAAGKKFPWTKDKLLRKYKFTNVFRQLDRVTQEWTARYARLLGKDPSPGDILFHCGLFRMFNWPETYDELNFNLSRWDYDKAVALLTKRKDAGHQIFTGAYIIPNAGREDPKIEVICEAADMLHFFKDDMAEEIMQKHRMEDTCEILQLIPTVGGFISYEIACDLRFTRVLANASDRLMWANPGPGAMRGVHRLMTKKAKWPKGKSRPDYQEAMREIFMQLTRKKKYGKLDKSILHSRLAPFEMREVEHSLCEFDKYMRAKNGEGKPRSRFKLDKPKKPIPALTRKELTQVRRRIKKERKERNLNENPYDRVRNHGLRRDSQPRGTFGPRTRKVRAPDKGGHAEEHGAGPAPEQA